MARRAAISALIAVALSGCATLAPPYRQPALPTPDAWPDGGGQPGQASASDLPWRQVVADPRLQQVVELALAQNRDLRVAVANIERARGLYGVQRAELLPSIDAVAAATRVRTPDALSGQGRAAESREYSVSLGFAAYELDLFGRVRSLSESARQAFFATEENRRAAQTSLIAEVTANYATLAADQDLLQVIQATLTTREDAVRLTASRVEAGASSDLDLRQTRSLAEQARSDAAAAAALVAQDRNALQLVVGAPVPEALLPRGDVAGLDILADLPPGLPSQTLLRRPDVLAAEHLLKARNADIGAARAAFFPRISLTGSAGTASPALSNLF